MNDTQRAIWNFSRRLAIPAAIAHAACMLMAIDDGSPVWATVFALNLAYLLSVIITDRP